MPYVVLTLASVAAAAWILWRRRDAALLATFFLAGGAVLAADYLALVWLELYQYRPGLMLKGTIPDSVTGALLAEGLFIPALAVILIALWPGWRAVTAGVVAVTVIEWVFVHLDALAHQGWRIWYTPVGFAAFFWLADRFRAAARERGLSAGWTRAAARLGLLLHLLQIEEAFVTLVKGLVVAAKHVVSPYLANHARLVSLPQYLTVVPVAFWVVNGSREQRWFRLAAASGLFTALDYLWVWLGWWVIKPPLTPLWHAAGKATALLAACLVDDILGRWAAARKGWRQRLQP